MERIIEIDINNKYDLIDKYNDKKISNELLTYIIKQATIIKKSKNIKIIINKNCDIDTNITRLIKYGLEEEYDRSLKERNSNNIKQFIFFLIGMTFIFLSTLIKDRLMWKEILLITGWVPIWEMIEVELFPDAYGRKERTIIKKLLNSEIVERNIETEVIK